MLFIYRRFAEAVARNSIKREACPKEILAMFSFLGLVLFLSVQDRARRTFFLSCWNISSFNQTSPSFFRPKAFSSFVSAFFLLLTTMTLVWCLTATQDEITTSVFQFPWFRVDVFVQVVYLFEPSRHCPISLRQKRVSDILHLETQKRESLRPSVLSSKLHEKCNGLQN